MVSCTKVGIGAKDNIIIHVGLQNWRNTVVCLGAL